MLLDDLKSKSLIITIMITLCLAILKSAAFTVYFLYITFRLETSDNFEDYSISILGLSGKFVAWILLIMSLLEVAYIYYAAESLEQSRKLLRITEKPIKLTEREDEDFGFKTEQDLDN